MSSIRFNPSTLLPLSTFFSLLDLKLGSEIITYLALLNKVAGVYGLLAVFFGGTTAQVSLYLYSIGTIILCAWGLRQIGQVCESHLHASRLYFYVQVIGLDEKLLKLQENPANSLFYAHLYGLDHVVSTLYTIYFGVQWYIYNPHDGQRVANSAAQKAMKDFVHTGESESETARKALAVWRDERGFSTAVLILGWFLKVCNIDSILTSKHIQVCSSFFP